MKNFLLGLLVGFILFACGGLGYIKHYASKRNIQKVEQAVKGIAHDIEKNIK